MLNTINTNRITNRRWRLKGKPGCLGNLPGSADSCSQPDMELPRLLRPRVRHCRARGVVQPKYICDYSFARATFSVQRAEAEILRPVAAARPQVDRRTDLAWQLHRSVPCADITRPHASGERVLLRAHSRSKGIDRARHACPRGVLGKS